ncbi:COG4223 family protein [Roseovarius sp. 2305UL8-3]|uniref:COG4223 family protein n=1 Tax=Roseovarius conchicola TaxID=3121636 RepID=UPI0035289455
MAEKKTSRTRAKTKKTDVSEAEGVEDITADSADAANEAVDQVADAGTVDEAMGKADESESGEAKDASVEEDSGEPLILEYPQSTDVAPEPEPEPTPEPEIAATETATKQPGRFFPMLMGGVVTAGLGFGAAYYGLGSGPDTSELEQKISDQIATQSDQVASLSAALDDLPPPADLSALEAAQGDMSSALESLADRLAALEAQVSSFDSRLTDVEKRPLTEGASDAAVAAYERELKALQDAMAAQRAEIEAMAAEAQTMEASAEETAQATMRRAALTRIQTALDTGSGFAPALADLEAAGMSAPAILAQVAETGAPSLAQLQADFPEAARAALAVSRRDAAVEGEGGFAAFLKNQLGARSLEPREGDEPDAVLSRAEAAARDGRLTDALAEIEALPESGRAEMSDWVAQATIRLDAVAAAETLGSELN